MLFKKRFINREQLKEKTTAGEQSVTVTGCYCCDAHHAEFKILLFMDYSRRIHQFSRCCDHF